MWRGRFSPPRPAQTCDQFIHCPPDRSNDDGGQQGKQHPGQQRLPRSGLTHTLQSRFDVPGGTLRQLRTWQTGGNGVGFRNHRNHPAAQHNFNRVVILDRAQVFQIEKWRGGQLDQPPLDDGRPLRRGQRAQSRPDAKHRLSAQLHRHAAFNCRSRSLEFIGQDRLRCGQGRQPQQNQQP